MPTVLQFRRGTTAQNNSFTGAAGEISIDTDKDTVRIHDGSTAGGVELVNTSGTQTLTNKSIDAGQLTGSVADARITSSSVTQHQGNITGTGALNSGSITSGFGSIDIGASNFTTTGTYNGNGAPLTNLNGSNITTGTVPSARISGSYTGITGTGALNAGSITSGFGAIDIGTDTVTLGGILNANADGVGNIGASGDSFNTVFAKATSAQYADLAEKYEADAEYAPGTVIVIGGAKEVTQSFRYADSGVVGVVSTNPAHIMNSALDSEHVIDLALTGRVPCKVIGTISRGDCLTTSELAGVATKLNNSDFVPGCVLGKALEDYSSEEVGVIEVLVGKS